MSHLVKKIFDFKFELGEGLLWDNFSERLLMTDILKGDLIEIDIESKSHRSWQFDEALAWVLPTRQGGRYLLGLKSGVALWEIHKPQIIHWVNKNFPGTNEQRLNDACVDADGRIWYGSMNLQSPSSRDGKLASFLPSEGLCIHDDGFTVTNGPVISLDGNYLFVNDTLNGVVFRYSLSLKNGKLSDRRLFAKFRPDEGYPDGMCLDVEGNLWIALWGGAAIVQLDTNGRLLRKIDIPAPNVTNLCFCGPKLNRLVVSTASIELSEEGWKHYPDSGGLFEITDHNSSGLAPHRASLEHLWT